MPRAFEAKIYLPYQHWASCTTIYRLLWRMGQQSVHSKLSGFTSELRDENKAEANVVVAIVGAVAVAISTTAVPRVVVPAATAQHTIRAHD